MAKASRDAGKRAEREARDELKALWPDARRGLPQSAGPIEADIENIPLRAEVKSWKRWPNVEAAIEQCARDAAKRGDSRPQCVIHKRKSVTKWRITFTMSEFVRFVQKARSDALQAAKEQQDE
ncbi:MAG TPA: hypothetical protein VM487_03920 [Phycisphaerae bacterium]|nr:hypothetical protein [Phycisphaerae bacterium]HUU94863.1 hypothetical protein [Phycisphaerae bacterium]